MPKLQFQLSVLVMMLFSSSAFAIEQFDLKLLADRNECTITRVDGVIGVPFSDEFAQVTVICDDQTVYQSGYSMISTAAAEEERIMFSPEARKFELSFDAAMDPTFKVVAGMRFGPKVYVETARLKKLRK